MTFDPTTAQPITNNAISANNTQIQGTVAPQTSKFDPTTAKPVETSIPSKILAGVGSFTNEALHGVGQTIEAVPNIAAASIGMGLDLLNKAGIVPDSVNQKYMSVYSKTKQAVENAGQKVLDFQNQAAKTDENANPTISKYSGIAGNLAGSAVTAGGIVGDVGKGLSTGLRMAVNQGLQGTLVGAGADSDHPLIGGALGAGLGAVAGRIAGHLNRSAEIINDKVDDALRIGMSPYSEAGIKSIKGALDSNGKELTTEEVEKATKIAIQNKLDSAAPKVDINQSPTDMIVNMAKANQADVLKTRDELYAPLHESMAPTTTNNLQTMLSKVSDKSAQKLLPDALPQNPAMDDLLNYRRQVSAGINQADRALKTGAPTANFKTVKQLNQVKQAITQDLNISAQNAGLGDQLAKADAFHINQVKPFEVYNTTTGKLVSPTDTKEAWSKVSKLLKPRMPNLNAMSQVASTLGPQGKQIFGYAYLQQAINRSMNVDGRIFPSKISGELNKLQNSGLAAHILTPELNEAFEGARNIAEGAIKTTKGMAGVVNKGLAARFIDWCTHSTGGITLLRGLGSKTASQARIKNIVSQLLVNLGEKQAGSNGQFLPEEDQQQ